jgi:hypothetical protein
MPVQASRRVRHEIGTGDVEPAELTFILFLALDPFNNNIFKLYRYVISRFHATED